MTLIRDAVAADAAITNIGAIEAKINEIDPATIPEDAKPLIAQGVEAVVSIDFTASVGDPLIGALETALEAGPMALLTVVESGIDDLRAELDHFKPSEAIGAQIGAPFEELAATLRGFSPSALLQRVQDALDDIAAQAGVLDIGVVPRYLAKEGLFTHKFTGPIVRGADQIPVLRYTDEAKNVLGPTEDAVRAGKPVIIYPEGTITRDPDAWPMSGRTGAVRVALATGAPLIPVCQSGAQDVLWPYTRRFRVFPPKRYHVTVGPPLDLSMYAGKPITEEILHEATNRLMDILTDMMSEIRGTRPTTARIDVHSVKKDTHVGEEN